MDDPRAAAEAVLRENDRGTYTIPAPRLYPHQWAWDSAFAAIGWAHIDPERAWTELRTLLSSQWRDGRIPHITFHDLESDYVPGPSFWETERTSSITQPPMWATAARRIVEVTGVSDPVAALLPKIDASHRFFHAQRDPLGWGLVAVAHPWESGLDNAPVWDLPLSRIDPVTAPPLRRRDAEILGDATVLPTDEHYGRYAALAKAIAAEGFGQGPFAVYDPMTSAILARAESDLAFLADRQGMTTDAAHRASSIRRALVEHLWDERRGRFVYVDARTEIAIPSDVIGGYVPLFCGLGERLESLRPRATGAPRRGKATARRATITERLVAGLRERYATSWPLPTTAPTDPAFEPRRYWRGPTWVNTNWLLAPALGGNLVDRTLELVREHGFRECYHPETGEGLGADSFTWTAALALDLLARRGR